ncbi:MAG: hypothetical protein JXM70_09020 [Pirellulales bacterium]|nr:hypothetical protein [Pirellulales bacterium]
MAIYVQHGHGKSDKITNALDDKSASGVIFAARNEKVDKLDRYITTLRENYECDLLFDPQFYVSTLIPANDRYLPDEYRYYEAGRTAKDFIGARKIASYVNDTINFQTERGFDRIMSPTVIANGFSDRWSQIALQLADSSIEYHSSLTDATPLLVSLVLSEGALDSRSDLDAFLDILTSWDVHGYYITVVRDDATYSQSFYEDRLAHLLYMVYILADRNEFEVVCGYSDFIGIPLRAAGASAFATGWYQSLRQFHQKAFLKRKNGGQPPRLRYSSSPLLNSIMLGELESISDAGYLDQVLSDVDLDSIITDATSPESSAWTSQISDRHHWQTLAKLDQDLSGPVRRNIMGLIADVRQATGLYATLKAAGVPFERNTDGQHLFDWLAGLQTFIRIAAL